jgi:hypothetical protein
METNSHRFGFFQESVVEYEIVTVDGKVIKVNLKVLIFLSKFVNLVFVVGKFSR